MSGVGQTSAVCGTKADRENCDGLKADIGHFVSRWAVGRSGPDLGHPAQPVARILMVFSSKRRAPKGQPQKQARPRNLFGKSARAKLPKRLGAILHQVHSFVFAQACLVPAFTRASFCLRNPEVHTLRRLHVQILRVVPDEHPLDGDDQEVRRVHVQQQGLGNQMACRIRAGMCETDTHARAGRAEASASDATKSLN